MKLQNLHIPVSKIVDSSSAFDGSPIRSPAIHTPQSASKAGGTKSGLCENPAYVSAMVFNYEELVVILEHLSDLISGCPGLVTSLYASFDCDPLKSDLLQPMIVYLTQSSRFSLLSNAYGTYSGDGVKHGSRSNLNAVEAGGYKLRNSDNPFTFKQLQSLSTLCRHAVNELLHKLAGNIPQATTTDESGDVEISPIVESGKRGGFMANYLCFSRDSKSLLIEATKLFIEKPSKAFSFLRAKGCLPAAPPLSPCFAAKFLRSLSNAKEAIGAFIGELGKKDALHECDSEEFRTAVRQEYVNTFHFTDQSVLDCVRIFLSAFRLPGEAQQIDRILVAFSEKCHMSCEEGKSGLLENAEVTYLLTFSIIMLNTDCHNPNIRADRKMTLAQFIRNNSNYGKDVNQTKPLSNEFLESIYSSISEFPLRTENTDVSGELTKEMWMDYQLQCEQNLDMSMMVNTHVDVDCLEGLKKSMQCGVAMRHHVAEHGEVVVDCVDNDGKAAASEDFQCKDAANAVLQMLTSKIPVIDPVRISSRIHGLHSFLDTEILKFVWIHFIGLAISPFLCHLIVVPEMVVSMDANGNTVVVVSNYNAQLSSEQYVSINSNNTSGISNNAPRTPGPANGSLADEEGGVAANIKLEFPVAEQYEHNTVSAQALRKAVDILTSLIELCHVHGLFDEVDMILSLLSDLAGGFLQGKLIDRFVDKYCPDIGYKLMSSSQHEYYRNKRMYYSTLMLPSAISRNAEISVPMKGVNEQSAAVIPNRRHSTGDLHHATESSSPMSGVVGIEDADVDANNNGSACMLYENRSASVTTSYEVWVHDEFLNDMAIQCRKRDIFVHIITESIRARAALGTFLQLIIHSPRYVRSSTWVIVWYMLGLLRDCSLLSGEMVLLDNDGDDALPNECKEQFENTLKHTMLAVERSLIGSDKRFRLKQVYAKQQEEKRLEQKQKALNIGGSVASQSPGVIYGLFQGIGDVLFGADESMSEGNDDALAEKSDIVITEDMVVAEWLHFGDSLHHALLAGKWDAGYDFCRVKTAIARNPADTEFKKLRGSQSGKDELEGNANSLASVRELILVCGCSQLIASSRYFSDETLVSFVSSLIMLSEMSPSTLHAPVDASKSSNQSFDQLLVSRSLTDSENIALANYLVSGSRASSGSSDGIVDNDDSELVANHHRSSATPRHSTPSGTPAKSFDFETPISSTYTLPADLRQADSLHTMLQDVLTKENVIMKPSSSTVAWLESVIIEISLRNRDRIATLIWPLLNQHYRVTIGGGINEGYPDQSNSKSCRIISPVALSYSLERRVAGVFKIATKMLSRGGDELRDDIMSLLQDLFVVVSGGGITTVTPGATVVSDFNPPKPTEYAGNASEKGSTHTVEITLDDSMGAGVNAVVVSETEVALSNSFSSPNDMAQTPAQTLSNQIAGHMWKFLTGNVSVLPLLSLKQWQTIFDIINATAGADQYAAVKSFEVCNCFILFCC